VSPRLCFFAPFYFGDALLIGSAASALDFLSNLIGATSLSEIVKLSATQARTNFDAASAQNIGTLRQKSRPGKIERAGQC
jgi:hypothetical protein